MILSTVSWKSPQVICKGSQRGQTPISASDASPMKQRTRGLRYQMEDSEAERKNQPPKEREKLVLV